MAQGDIWWAESELGRRPVLVVTRNEAIDVLNKVVVAPITRTVRDIPTEVPLNTDDGLPHRSAASFDNLRAVAKSHLTERRFHLAPSLRDLRRARRYGRLLTPAQPVAPRRCQMLRGLRLGWRRCGRWRAQLAECPYSGPRPGGGRFDLDGLSSPSGCGRRRSGGSSSWSAARWVRPEMRCDPR